MNEKLAIEVLKQVKEVLDRNGVEFWLDYGTLLGAVRDGRFIPWDFDIDFAAWDNEKQKVSNALKEIQDKELEKKCSFDVHFYHLSDGKATATWYVPNKTRTRQILNYLHGVISKEYHVVEQGRMPIFATKALYKFFLSLPSLLTKQIDKVVLAVYKKCEKNGSGYLQVSVPSHYFINLSTIRFYGIEFKVPADTENYLAHRYGKDWKIPKKSYVSFEQDGGICK